MIPFTFRIVHDAFIHKLMPINPIIAADTLLVVSTRHSHVRLMNDSRWPWLILLPRNSAARELHELEGTQRNGFLQDVNLVSHTVKAHTRCSSINIAMLGNVVPDLHCHVVARSPGDPNWPAPIWGYGQAVSYDDNLPDDLVRQVQQALSVDSNTSL